MLYLYETAWTLTRKACEIIAKRMYSLEHVFPLQPVFWPPNNLSFNGNKMQGYADHYLSRRSSFVRDPVGRAQWPWPGFPIHRGED